MELSWVREESPTWDADKRRVIGGAPEGAFVIPFADGEGLPGEWWSARDGDGVVVGYGRLDTTWGGDAEILLAVDPGRQQQGVGSFVLARLEDEAAARGINYIHNRIREHADRDLVHDWLVVRGFRGPSDGDLRKRVRPAADEVAQDGVRREQVRPAEAYDADADPGGQAPGHEEQGGYVDVEEHRY
ncbi:MAG TPA: GNAT family N-acetyltransferase [Marmoricola sp.]|nr:GNAT family N-acetyltransferase [Marmoricola sp.]